MEEIEVATEKEQEEVIEQALEKRNRWTMSVALTSAILAALAAVTALMAGHHSNEAMIEQLQASDQWGYYQAKGIKAAVLNTKIQIFQAMGKSLKATEATADQEKFEQYKKDQDEIQDNAKELEASAKKHLNRHVILARGVTLFQVAIAVAAISILTRRRRYYIVSLVFGACGLVFLIQDLLLN